jgi:hypothetical protein
MKSFNVILLLTTLFMVFILDGLVLGNFHVIVVKF